MKNYFVIHALGRTAEDYWYSSIKEWATTSGYNCYTPTLPPMDNMSYSTWAAEFDKYSKFLNKDSVVIGHSTGCIFLVKYLMEHNIKVAKYISVVGFNRAMENSPHPDWDNINKSFFVTNLAGFKKYAKQRISFYSPTDLYDFKILDDFATTIDAQKVIIKNAGHFTSATGYDKEFPELIKYL